jgi:hypothetical protein
MAYVELEQEKCISKAIHSARNTKVDMLSVLLIAPAKSIHTFMPESAFADSSDSDYWIASPRGFDSCG